MAPFVPLEDGAQVQLVFVLDGEIISNRLWFWTADPPFTSAHLVGLADGVYDWYTALILPSLSDELQLATVVATDWTSAGNVGEVTTRPPINGGIAEGSHSANVALSVGFRWPTQYSRLKRNKNYVAGVPLSEINLNTPTPHIQDVLFEGYAALIDAARTFTPGDYWYWVVTSAWYQSNLRDAQFFGVCIGPPNRAGIILGQRRKRLPLS